MYVFVDDSGDPGFKFGQGSSNFLVIACCVFASPLEVDLASKHVATLKRKLNANNDFELKFHKSRFETKIILLESLGKIDFFVRVLIVDKRGLPSTKDLQNSVLISALDKLGEGVADAKVTIDGVLPKKHAQELSTRIRKKVNRTRKVILSVRFRDSKADSLIQLADLIAGAYRSIHEQKDQTSISYSKHLRVIESRTNSAIYYLNS